MWIRREVLLLNLMRLRIQQHRSGSAEQCSDLMLGDGLQQIKVLG